MKIQRDYYLNKLINRKDNGLIKIIKNIQKNEGLYPCKSGLNWTERIFAVIHAGFTEFEQYY